MSETTRRRRPTPGGVDIEDLSPRAFERLAAVCWEAHGWRAAVTAPGPDAGIDVVARRTAPVDQCHLLQAKRRAADATVSAPTVRDAASLYRRSTDVNAVAVVASCEFTAPARRTAANVGVELVGRPALERLVSRACRRLGERTVTWLLGRPDPPLCTSTRIRAVRPRQPGDGVVNAAAGSHPSAGTDRDTGLATLLRASVRRLARGQTPTPSTLVLDCVPAAGRTTPTEIRLCIPGRTLVVRGCSVDERRRIATRGRRQGRVERVSAGERRVVLRFGGATGRGAPLLETVEGVLAAGGGLAVPDVLRVTAPGKDERQRTLYRAVSRRPSGRAGEGTASDHTT